MPRLAAVAAIACLIAVTLVATIPAQEREERRPEREEIAEQVMPHLRSAIEGLNALGHEELAHDIGQRAETIQDRMHRSLARHRPERREEREYAPVHPEISHAIRQLLRDVKEIKENPPVHPEINHVIKELRQQVRELREQVGELRRSRR